MKYLIVAVLLATVVCWVKASSHSEAPGTYNIPNADITDVYAFRSYETGRSDFVTIIWNVHGLQYPGAGPNYFALSDRNFYEIYIDNDGDAQEDITFQFMYGSSFGGDSDVLLDFDNSGDPDTCTEANPPPRSFVGPGGVRLNIGGNLVAIPLKHFGPITRSNPTANLNFFEYYSINKIVGDRDNEGTPVTKRGTDQTKFTKPYDNVGDKTFPEGYADYANLYVHEIDIPDCATPGRVFVGQRKEGFALPLGKIFDLINLIPVDGFTKECPENNELGVFNVGSFALELPISCIKGSETDVVGIWSASRKLFHNGDSHTAGPQVARLGQVLVNELVVGLKDKGAFNRIEPDVDATLGSNFTNYVFFPTLPAIINLLFKDTLNKALKTNFDDVSPPTPRNDLFQLFFQGIPGLNAFTDGTPCEYIRLNLTVPPVPAADQKRYGVIAGDNAGFPNGRRPADDVVDVAIRVMMGVLCTLGLPDPAFNCTAPVGNVPFIDGVKIQAVTDFDQTFPYLKAPNPGALTNKKPQTCKSQSPASTLSYSVFAILSVLAALLFLL